MSPLHATESPKSQNSRDCREQAGVLLPLWVPSLTHDQQLEDFCRTEGRMHELSVKMPSKIIITLHCDKNRMQKA